MSDRFFIRIRGEVKGPYTREQVLSLLRKKRLGRHHELSEDAVTWQRAGDVPGLFESTAPEPIPAQIVPTEPQPSPLPQSLPTTPQDITAAAQSSHADDEWFYVKGKNTHGPVSSKELRALLATGRLLGSDRIWNESLSDWVPAEDVPQFMGSVTQTSTSPAERTSDRDREAPQSGFWDIALCLNNSPIAAASTHRFPNLCRFVVITESISRILFILLCAAASCFYVFLVCSWVYAGEIAVAVGTFFGGLIALVSVFFVFWLSFLCQMAVLEMVRVQLGIENNTHD